MNTFASYTILAAASLNAWAEFFKALAAFFQKHESTVFMLSVVGAAIFSVMMMAAYWRAKSEKWMKYFSWSFGLLSLQYVLFLVNWFRTLHPGDGTPHAPELSVIILIVHLVSMINNLCVVAAAQDIENKSPLVPRTAKILAAASVITIPAAYFFKSGNPFTDELLSRSFASIFSAYSLFIVGFAIFNNLSVRRHREMAFGAVAVAAFYAFLQLAYGASPLVAARLMSESSFEERLKLFDVLLVGFALPLKFLLCGFAYLVVMRFFETLNEVRSLPGGDDGLRQDYLSTNGVVRLIADKLGDHRRGARSAAADDDGEPRGFVNIIVKLPGEVNKRVVCIPWPNAEQQQRAVTFDWPKPTFFSRWILKDTSDYEEDEPVKPKPYEWEATLAFAGRVMTETTRREHIWLRDDPETHDDDDIPYAGDLKAIANVAIMSHGAVIGCLQIARSRYRFSQMGVRQIRVIANLLSPAVQAYRELASLDQLSIRFAWKQAEEKTYSPVESTQVIAEIIHDVFAPHVTRLHMDFGFSSEKPYYVREAYAARLEKKMSDECDGKEWEKIGTEIEAELSRYSLLKKQFTARVTETISTGDAAHQAVKDRFITGNLILAVNERDDAYGRAALGVTYLQRKAASTIAADAHLDFARDYYNALLKGLGKELSQKRLTVEEWFEPISLMLKSAGLPWVVMGRKKRDGKMGDDEGKYILNNFGRLAGRESSVTTVGEIEITHSPLKATSGKTNHVLRLDLRDSDCHMWLGVERPGFGPELDFASPWRTFLVNFAQIADATLSRIILPEKYQMHLEAAQRQAIVASVVTTGTVIHQLSNMIQGQVGTIGTLLDAVKLGKLVTDGKLVRMMEVMKGSTEDMQELFRSFDRLTKVDEHRPCQLKDAASHAFRLFRISLEQRRIRSVMRVDDGISIDVPLNVAALALANLVGNAKDAVGPDGEISIEAETNGAFAICRVRDNGSGMSDELKGVVFDPKKSSKDNGSGLGLYLTYHSLRENKSTIELTETGPSGTVFTVKFPLAKEERTV